MSEAKRGRPSKYGDKDAKKIIKSNAQKLLPKAKEAFEYDPAWGIHVGVLQWVTANPDLVKEDSVEGIAKAIQDYPELRINLLERANPDNSALTNIMLDAALRAGIVKVMQDEHLKDRRDDKTEIEKRVAATKAIAKKLIADNKGKQPRHFYHLIEIDLKQDFGGVSKSTIIRDLKSPDDQTI